MSYLKHEVLIDTPIEKVFLISQDYNLRIDWDSDLYEYNFEKGVMPKKAAVVWESYMDDSEMTLEFVSFIPHTYVAFKMTDGPDHLKKFTGAWKFEKKGNSTKTTFTCSYEFKSGFMNSLKSPIYKSKLQKMIKTRVEDLKEYFEV